jgi:hypothetical protein
VAGGFDELLLGADVVGGGATVVVVVGGALVVDPTEAAAAIAEPLTGVWPQADTTAASVPATVMIPHRYAACLVSTALTLPHTGRG